MEAELFIAILFVAVVGLIISVAVLLFRNSQQMKFNEEVLKNVRAQVEFNHVISERVNNA